MRSQITARSRVRWVPLLAFGPVLAAMSGCYAYAVTPMDQVPEGASVRARLSATEIDRLDLRELVPIDGQSVEGRVQSSPDADLRLLVPVRLDGGWTPQTQELNQLLAINRAGVLEMEVRQFKRGQTFLLAGVGAAAVTAIIIDQLTGWFGGGREAFGPDKGGVM